jgi:redox-sensitive bicupin YhaK (pirin superfamily)
MAESESIAQVLGARERDLGGFPVRRALPSAFRKLVGPFIFFDHMGPVTLEPGQGMDVRPHPHINLATVTYLFEGEIVHRDSVGSEQVITPGAVNWMTAGKGIVHSERSASEQREKGPKVHGIQSWVALPREHEEREPTFRHYGKSVLPTVKREGVELRVLAGKAYGVTSPVEVLSPTLYVEAKIEAGAQLEIDDEYVERAVYVVNGAIVCDDTRFESGAMIIFKPWASVSLTAVEGAHLMILGGAPLDGPRHIWWNFVSSSQERIEQAKREWKEGLFPKVPGDDQEFIPLPESWPAR